MFYSTVLFQGIMLVYDITNEKSFENIKTWIRNIEEVGELFKIKNLLVKVLHNLMLYTILLFQLDLQFLD